MSLAKEITHKVSRLLEKFEDEKSEYAIRQIGAQMVADRIAQGTGLRFLRLGIDGTFSCRHGRDSDQDMLFKQLRKFKIVKAGGDKSFRYYYHKPSYTNFIFVCNVDGDVIELRIEFPRNSFEHIDGNNIEEDARAGVIRLFGENFI